MKRRRLLTRCLLWGAVVLWMAVIFLFSGQNGEDSSSLSLIHISEPTRPY